MLRPGANEPARRLEGERRRLLRRYASHGRADDLERLVLSYRPLARGLARRYESSGSREDLEQVACEGLIKAIKRYDPDRGYAFTSFAVPTILGELRRYRRDTGWTLHVPRAVQERVQALRAASDRLTAATGRTPTARELADCMACDEEAVVEALCAASSQTVVPLDGPPRIDGDADSVADRLGVAEPGYDQVDCLAAIEDALGKLTPTELTIVKLRYGDELTQREIAGQMHVSRSEVARVLRAAVERLRSVAASESPA